MCSVLERKKTKDKREPRNVLGPGRKKKDREPRNVLGPGGVKGKELRNVVSPGWSLVWLFSLVFYNLGDGVERKETREDISSVSLFTLSLFTLRKTTYSCFHAKETPEDIS